MKLTKGIRFPQWTSIDPRFSARVRSEHDWKVFAINFECTWEAKFNQNSCLHQFTSHTCVSSIIQRQRLKLNIKVH